MIGVAADLVALALLSASAGPFDRMERITSQEAVKRAENCHIGAVKIRYDDEQQSDILTVTDAKEANEQQLVCLDEATGFGIFVELPPTLQGRFDAIREARASALAKEDASEWLSARGLLDRVPKYVAGTTDDLQFTRDVEKACGSRAEGAFQSKYGPHVLNPDWFSKFPMPPKSEDEEVLGCVFQTITLAGFRMAFIGNEAFQAPKP
jgi:hypothetical protein